MFWAGEGAGGCCRLLTGGACPNPMSLPGLGLPAPPPEDRTLSSTPRPEPRGAASQPGSAAGRGRASLHARPPRTWGSEGHQQGDTHGATRSPGSPAPLTSRPGRRPLAPTRHGGPALHRGLQNCKKEKSAYLTTRKGEEGRGGREEGREKTRLVSVQAEGQPAAGTPRVLPTQPSTRQAAPTRLAGAGGEAAQGPSPRARVAPKAPAGQP